MSAELKGFCVIQITKRLVQEVLEGKPEEARAAAAGIGYLVAASVKNSPYQPCEICRIEIVEGQQS